MVSTKKVNVFGRDQESCDHVLGNPSVSRKHAAIIHDEKGGIYVSGTITRADEVAIVCVQMLIVFLCCRLFVSVCRWWT